MYKYLRLFLFDIVYCFFNIILRFLIRLQNIGSIPHFKAQCPYVLRIRKNMESAIGKTSIREKQALIYNKCLLLTVEAFLPSKFSDLYILFGWIFHTSTNFVLHTYIHVKHCLHGLAQLFCSLPFYFQEVAQAIVLPIVTYPLLTQDRPATGDILPETAGLRGYIQ